MINSILVIEDEEVLKKALQRFFQKKQWEVVVSSRGEEGLQLLRQRPFDILLADLMLPEVSGIEIVRKAKEIQPSIAPIVMTGFGTIPTAVEAIKAGALHYITKPFELDDLYALIEKGLEHKQLKQENLVLRQALKKKFSHDNIVGTSPKMQEIFRLVERVAATDSTVLILGESGTGKELLAKSIHFRSNRADRPLVTVNCAAIPENLLESELFGHVKGAFTGAVNTHLGRFDQAHGGTVFLDEIGDMSPRLQVKVLRVLQDRRFEPVGSNKTHEVDVRIITATNRDLHKEVEEGHFREDLYYRLNVIPIEMPPLRDRKEDVPLLLDHFLKVANQENGKSVTGFSPQAKQFLLEYSWPGNIRELENLVERLVILKGQGTAGKEDLPASFFNETPPEKIFEKLSIPEGGVCLKELVNEFENVLIREAMKKCHGNKNQAAQLLKLNRTTLIEKMKKKGLEEEGSNE